LIFYGHPDAEYATKRKPKVWARVQAELEQLKKSSSPTAEAGEILVFGAPFGVISFSPKILSFSPHIGVRGNLLRLDTFGRA
jgi:hypothetical protein